MNSMGQTTPVNVQGALVSLVFSSIIWIYEKHLIVIKIATSALAGVAQWIEQ